MKAVESRHNYWSLLFVLFLAPACSPKAENPVVEEDRMRNLVLLTNPENWQPQELDELKDSLQEENFRVIISGYPGEHTESLLQRLPWLLQPGVDLLLCDPAFIAPSGMDSVRNFLKASERTIEVRALEK